jgi:lysophospholipid acyltransferase (LPLAT)-like uncharacterized protein
MSRWSKETIVATIATGIIKLLAFTYRVQIRDEGGLYDLTRTQPFVIMLWHNRILSSVLGEWKTGRKRKRLTVLTSPSRDGGWVAAFVSCFHMDAVRGSSSRRGAGALRDLRTLLKSGRDVVITPDGPRGPVYQPSLGAIFLARNAGVPLTAMRVTVSSAWRLKSWDGFMIPKPFAQLTLHTVPTVLPPPLLAEIAGDPDATQKQQIRADQEFLRSLLGGESESLTK